MTKDQETRLIAAFNNVEHLVHEEEFAALITETVAILTGKAGELEEDMARPKGSSNKKKAEAITITNQPEVFAFSIPSDRDQLIAEWKAAADQLGELKAKEHALRQALVAQCFDGKKLEGSETVDIGYGYSLRAVKELAYNATDKNGETKALLAILRTRGDVGTSCAEALIRWQPDVAKRTYKEVLALAKQYEDNEILGALHAAIVLKPGMPQLELVPPKQDEPTAPVETPVVQPPVWNGVIEDNFIPEQ